MLFILFVLIYAYSTGVVITDITTFCDSVCFMEVVPLLIASIVILSFYIYSYCRVSRRVDKEELRETSVKAIVSHAIIGLFILYITSNKSYELRSKMIWLFVVLWPLIMLSKMIITGRKKKISYMDCFFRFFDLEIRMVKTVIEGIGFFMKVLGAVIMFIMKVIEIIWDIISPFVEGALFMMGLIAFAVL